MLKMVIWKIFWIILVFVVIYFCVIIWVVNVVFFKFIMVSVICGLFEVEEYYSVWERYKFFWDRDLFYCDVLNVSLLYNVLDMVDGELVIWW